MMTKVRFWFKCHDEIAYMHIYSSHEYLPFISDEPQIVATPRDVVNERTVTELLKDAADGKETIFIVNLLSFIKDGKHVCIVLYFYVAVVV